MTLLQRRLLIGLCLFPFHAWSAPLAPFGDGTDGALTVNEGESFETDAVRSAVTGDNLAGGTTVAVANSSGFLVGDEVLIITMQDPEPELSLNQAGTYETAAIAAIDANTLELTAPLAHTYLSSSGAKHQVTRVPQYTTVDVSGTLTCADWNGETGGVLFLRAAESVTMDETGIIHADGKGYRGGLGNDPDGSVGRTGEGITGNFHIPSVDPAANGAGAGPGGGGGGSGSAGRPGALNPYNFGRSVGDPTLRRLICGGGGGGGNDNDNNHNNVNEGRGGDGGGIIVIAAPELTGSEIRSNGGDGTSPDDWYTNSADGAGGGGAGGVIHTTTLNLDIATLSAAGGGGGFSFQTSANRYFSGGDGGDGRIRVNASTVAIGATRPEPYYGELRSLLHNPLPNQAATDASYLIAARATDDTVALTTATVHYQVDGDGFNELAMVNDGQGTFTADIPAQAPLSVVDYYISASDGATTHHTPTDAPAAVHAFTITDSPPTYLHAAATDNGEVTLTWGAPVSAANLVDYSIYRTEALDENLAAEHLVADNITDLTYVDSAPALQDFRTYYYHVRANYDYAAAAVRSASVIAQNDAIGVSVVKGFVNLEGQTDHGGVTVQFNDNGSSNSAVTVHATTDASGYFEQAVNNGNYEIRIVKAGYRDYVLSSNTFIDSDRDVGTRNLYDLGLTDVAGDVFGELSGIISITGAITVPAGRRLVIKPGSELRFLGNDHFIVHGYLVAEGTAEAPIRFTSLPESQLVGEQQWQGIDFTDSSDDRSRMSHIIIENCQDGIEWNRADATVSSVEVHTSNVGFRIIESSNPSINDADIHQNTYGIFIEESSPTITHSNIYDQISYGFHIRNSANPILTNCDVFANRTLSSSDFGINIETRSSPTLIDCKIRDNNDIGLRVYSQCNPEIRGCTISGNNGDGMYVYDTDETQSDMIIEDCLIAENSSEGIYLDYYNQAIGISNCEIRNNSAAGIYLYYDNDPRIRSNVIAENDYGIYISNNYNDLNIERNIVISNANDGVYKSGTNGTTTIAYNTIYGNGGDGYENNGTGTETVLNNIIVNNTGYGLRSNQKIDDLRFNCIAMNAAGDISNTSSSYIPADAWSFITVNPNGVPADKFLNISEDPLFRLNDALDLQLLAGSPCIDAADPDVTDPDLTRSDVGALYHDSGHPMNIVATTEDQTVILTWPPVTTDLHGTLLGYNVYRRDAGADEFELAVFTSESTLTINDLINNAAYEFAVTGVYDSGHESVHSAIITERPGVAVIDLDRESLNVSLEAEIGDLERSLAVSNSGTKALSVEFENISADYGAAKLDGSGDYINVGDHDNLEGMSALTLECWIRSWNSGPFDFLSKGYRQYNLFVDGNRKFGMTKGFSNTYEYRTSNYELPRGEWHHLAVSWQKNELVFFVDGNEVFKSQDVNASPISLRSDSFRIGDGDWQGPELKGDITEVRIWKTARTAKEIRATILTPLSGDEENLVGYWPLSLDFTDHSTFRRHGSKVGHATILHDIDVPRVVSVGSTSFTILPGTTENIPFNFHKGFFTDSALLTIPILTNDPTRDVIDFDVHANYRTPEPRSTYFDPVYPTAGGYTIVITEATLNDHPLDVGDEIGVFDGDLCVGGAIFDGRFNMVIPVWEADDGAGLPGFTLGNPMLFRLYDASDDVEGVVTEVDLVVGDGTFGYQTFSALSLNGHAAADATHFVPVPETGQFYRITVTDATINGEPLEAGDEIAVVDGDVTVGVGIYGGAFPVDIIAWQADTGSDLAGFTVGNSISYRVFDQSRNKEALVAYADYLYGDGSFGNDASTSVSLTAINNPPTTFFTPVAETGGFATIVVASAVIDGEPAAPGDEIGIFDGDTCIGAGIADQAGAAVLHAWRAAPQLGQPGFTEGHLMRFQIYRRDVDRAVVVTDAVYDQGDGSFDSSASTVVTLTGHRDILDHHDGTATLTWEAPDDTTGLLAYEVHRSLDDVFSPGGTTVLASDLTDTTYTDADLADAVYYYRVVAVYEDGAETVIPLPEILINTHDDSTVRGFAFLEGRSNHAGIKITYEGISTLTTTEFAFTDALGRYEIPLTKVGQYAVTYEKDGFLSYTPYRVGGALLNVTDDIVSDDVTLLTLGVNDVSGEVSGVWDGIYTITGDVSVPENNALVIRPGSRIQFVGKYQFDVFGYLEARGEANSKILFTFVNETRTPGPGNWWGIDFNDSSDDTSIISHAVIEFADDGVEWADASAGLENAEVHHHADYGLHISRADSRPHIVNVDVYSNQRGIRVDAASPVLDQVSSRNNLNSSNGYGLWMENIPTVVATNCRFDDNRLYGIYMQESSRSVFTNCSFNDNQNTGIYVNRGDVTIENSEASRNTGYGILLNNGGHNGRFSRILNCQIADNTSWGMYIATNSNTANQNDAIIVADNNVRRNMNYGIYISNSNKLIVRDNVVSDTYRDNTCCGRGSGIYIGSSSNQLEFIRNVVMRNASDGVYNASSSNTITFDNNTILNNRGDGFETTSSPTITSISNNIIIDNDHYAVRTSSTIPVFGFNNIRNNGSGLTNDLNRFPVNTWDFTDVNNGYPADVHGNISIDPLFRLPIIDDYSLHANSPCIDAGDPAASDPDGTRLDIGALYWDQGIPHSLTVTGYGDESVALTWQAATGNNFGPVAGYNVYYRESGSDVWLLFDSTDQPAIAVTGLVNNVLYEFAVTGLYPGNVESDVSTAIVEKAGVPTITITPVGLSVVVDLDDEPIVEVLTVANGGTRDLNLHFSSFDGGVATFDGNGDFIQVGTQPHLQGLAALTIECWVRRENATFTELVSRHTPWNYQYSLYIDGNDKPGLYKGYQSTYQTFQSDFQIPRGEWHHLAVTWTDNVVKFYYDGELADEFDNAVAEPIPNHNYPLDIGRRGNYPDRYLHGAMAELRIWNRVRTGDQLKSDMLKPLADEEAGLVAYWPLRHDFLDLSGFDTPGTPNDDVFIDATESIPVSPFFTVESESVIVPAGGETDVMLSFPFIDLFKRKTLKIPIYTDIPDVPKVDYDVLVTYGDHIQAETDIFSSVNPSDSSYTIVIDYAEIDGEPLELGDVIAVLDGDTIVGVGVFDGFAYSFPAWEAHPDLSQDGFTAGNPMTFRLYDTFLALEATVTDVAFVVGDGTFGYNTFTSVQLSATVFQTQTVDIVGGRVNLISFNKWPRITDAGAVFGQVDALELVYDDQGFSMIPQFLIDTIVDIDFTRGYHVYSEFDDIIEFEGTLLKPTQTMMVLYPHQWNSVAFLGEDLQDVATTFGADPDGTALINDQIIAVQDDKGNMWTPTGEANTLTNLAPGRGYQIAIAGDDPIAFYYQNTGAAVGSSSVVRNAGAAAKRGATAANADAFVPVADTGIPYNILVVYPGRNTPPGAQLGVFDGDVCVGAATFGGEDYLQITAWGSDPFLGLPGFTDGHDIRLMLHTPDDGDVREIDADYLRGDGTFGSDLFALAHIDTPIPAVDLIAVADATETVPGVTNDRRVYLAIDGYGDGTALEWLVTESPAQPQAGDGRWQADRPTYHDIAADEGMVTLYIWVKNEHDVVSLLHQGSYREIMLDLGFVFTITSSRVESQPLRFGQWRWATAGYDDNLDERVDGAGTPYHPYLTRRSVTSDAPARFMTDIRPTEAVSRWRMHVAGPADNRTLSFDIPRMPAGAQLLIQRLAGEAAAEAPFELHDASSIAVQADDVYEIVLGQPDVADLPLRRGWNLIGIRHMTVETVGDLLAEYGLPQTISGMVWTWDGLGFKLVASDHVLRSECGYWVFNRGDPFTARYSGLPADGIVTVKRGWNAVGPTATGVVPEALAGGNEIWTWDGRSQAFRTPDGNTLQHDAGYLIRADEDTVVDLGNESD